MSKWGWAFWAIETTRDAATYIVAEKITTGNTNDATAIAAMAGLAFSQLLELGVAYKWYRDDAWEDMPSERRSLKIISAGILMTAFHGSMSALAGWQAGKDCADYPSYTEGDCLNPSNFKSREADATFAAACCVVGIHGLANTFLSYLEHKKKSSYILLPS